MTSSTKYWEYRFSVLEVQPRPSHVTESPAPEAVTVASVNYSLALAALNTRSSLSKRKQIVLLFCQADSNPLTSASKYWCIPLSLPKYF